MLHRLGKKGHILALVLFVSILAVGCAPSKYMIKSPPTTDVKSFKNVEVASVSTGVTKDEVNPGMPAELRSAIIEAIQNKLIYAQVVPESDLTESVLQIQAKIIEFDKGSQAARYFVGFGAGAASFKVECKFLNKETQAVIAEGTFKTGISGGVFGGASNQEKMAKDVAKQVAKFLKKGK